MEVPRLRGAGPVLFSAGEWRACELDAEAIPALQAFFASNPEYFIAVNGMPPRDDEAQQEFDDLPPPSMTFEKRWMLGFVDTSERLVGMAYVLSDFLAKGVWHIGLFIVATPLHGTGTSRVLYRNLEEWMRTSGANWIRLGAVVGNPRAERFWEKVGYAEVRRRSGVQMGNLTSTVRVFMKALGAGALDEYLRLVERDRPESTLP
jgi:GNAT superfamily N-acetyltransferase